MSDKVKGLVVDTVAEGKIIIMTEQGEFINIAWDKKTLPVIGQEVEANRPDTAKYWFKKWYALPLAASIVFMLMLFPVWNIIFPQQSQAVVAYVDIDINPSIELGLNQDGNVVEIIGLNKDGEKLLAGLELMNLPVQTAVRSVTLAAIEADYLTADKNNSILITWSSKGKIDGQKGNLENEVDNALKEKGVLADTDTLAVGEELHRQAKENNISTGKYVIFLEALEAGLDIKLEDLKTNSVAKAVENAGGTVDQLLSKAKKKAIEIPAAPNDNLDAGKKEINNQGSNYTDTGNNKIKNESKGKLMIKGIKEKAQKIGYGVRNLFITKEKERERNLSK